MKPICLLLGLSATLTTPSIALNTAPPTKDGPVTISSANSGWTWTGWSTFDDPECMDGAGRAGSPGSTASFTFDGSGVSLNVLRGASISVDGHPHKIGRIAVKLDDTFNSEISINYPDTQHGYVAFSAQDLRPGRHTIRIMPVAGWAVVDYLTITPSKAGSASTDLSSATSHDDPGPLSELSILPQAYKTFQGKDNQQPVATSIDTLDESGKMNDWVKYLQFQGRTAGTPYFGTRIYHVPVDVAPASVHRLNVAVNYLGPLPSLQTWTWFLYDWTTQTWTAIGTNAGSVGWEHWSTLSFTVDHQASHYVQAGTGEIDLATGSNNAADDADIDYERITIGRSKP